MKKQYGNWNFPRNRNAKNDRDQVSGIKKKVRKQVDMKKPRSSHTKEEYS